MNAEKVVHNFEPIYNEKSEILILGTFPSVKSRENNFYYGHPQNRFWRVISSVTNCELPSTIQQKTDLLLKNNIAIWDVIKSCEIKNSADSTIKSVEPNDLNVILSHCNISKIFANGQTAQKLYNQYIKKNVKYDIITLPSTSPANAAWSIERLVDAWKIIKD